MKKVLRSIVCGLIGGIGGLAFHIKNWGIFSMTVTLLFMFLFYAWVSDNY